MAIVVKDRVKVTFTTTGTADFTLGGASLGFQSFAIIGDGNETYYAAVDAITGDWEVGIGTYTTAGPTLTRTTILESSAGGSKVSFSAGSKDVFVTYPAERAVYLDTAGSYPVQSTFNGLSAALATLTAGTVATTPVVGTDIANKSYVDTIAAAGIHYHEPVFVESPSTAGNLTATYNQPGGAGVGVGATLTNAGTQVALTIDNVLMTTTKRVLIYNQTNAFENGVYTVTTVGDGSTNWVLTRATDADTYAPSSPNSLGQGDAFFVTSGDTGAGEGYVCTTVGTITFGTTAITFSQFSASVAYNAGTGLNLNPATTFNISNVGTAGTYGSASNVPVFVTNAQGQVTSVTNTGIAITSAAVSGLAASATTDTTDAANITSGVLPSGRISGSYTGLTGTGALAAGSLASGFTAVSAPLGGTGFSSYAVGDLIYADTTTSFAKLADVAVGNALISGGVGSAPSYGKIGLATHVSGTLPVASGGTGVTSSTGTGSVVLSDSPTLVTPALGTPSALVGTNITGTASGLTAGAATTATTATNQSGGTVSATSIVYSTTLTGGTGVLNIGSGQVYKDASGNVGIGTSSPLSRVDVRAPAGELGRFAISNTGVGYLVITGGAATSEGLRLSYDNSDGSSTINNFFNAPLKFSTNNTERARIDSSGNVGIGMTPTNFGNGYTVLQVANASNGGMLYLTNTANAGGRIYGNGAGLTYDAFSTTYHAFNTNSTERMRITSAGGVSFGATGTAYGTSGQVLTSAGNAPPTWATPTSAVIGTTTQVAYNNAGTMAGSANLTFNGTNLTCGGTVTANSDERLKTNWRALPENFVDLLALVQSGTYDRLDIDLTQDGISAQSLKPLLPNSVLADEDGTLSVAYGNAAMVAAVELAKRVVQLEALVAKLTKGT